jgi:uncharacterized repeat protein (TIGR04076 family)
MPKWPKVKVTVVKTLNRKDIYGNKFPAKVNEAMLTPQCHLFKEGQEFIMDMTCPPDFCPWAYADIQRDIMHILWGGSYPWIAEEGVAIACCTDGMRPVIFRIERIED